jgi:hypothetical protein
VLTIEVDRDGRMLNARVVSARQEGLGSPLLDPAGGAARLIDELSRTDFPEANIGLDAAGFLIRPSTEPTSDLQD